MQDFYVSMAADLLGVYIHYRAESRKALEEYLEREYHHGSGVWKLPWCAIYSQPGTGTEERWGLPKFIVKAKCGDLYEADSPREYAVVTVDVDTLAAEEAAANEVTKAEPVDSVDCAAGDHKLCEGEESALWPDGTTSIRKCSCACHTSEVAHVDA